MLRDRQMRTETEPWIEERARALHRLAALEPIHVSIHNPESCLTLKIAEAEEVPIVHRIIREAFAQYIGVLNPPATAATATLEDLLRSLPEGGVVLGQADGHPVAAAQFRLRADHLYIGRLAVLPAERGRGIAREVLGYMETIARFLDRRELRLGTRKSLPRNVALYLRNGYEIEEVTPCVNSTDSVVWLVKRLA